MKILLTTDTWVPTINGVVTSTATLRAALTAQGHEVRVLTLSGDSHTYTKDGVTSLGSLDAGLVYPGARMRAPALNRAIRDLIDWRPDIVHSQCEFSTFAPARRIAHAAGAPLIHTYHTVYEDYTHYFSPSRSMGRKMAALFTRMICADCDAVIAPTPKISRLLAGYGVHCPVRISPVMMPCAAAWACRRKRQTRRSCSAWDGWPRKKTQQNLSILCRICRTLCCSSSATAQSAPRWNSRRKASAWLTA